MSFVEVAANTLDTTYEVENSCRFYSNTDLKRLPSSTGSSLKATMSVWVKFGRPDTDMAIAGGWDNSGANDDDGYWVLYRQGSTGRLLFEGGTDTYLRTNATFRDCSAWYHIVLAIDSTQNDNDAQRLYVNGQELTSFAGRSNLTNLQDLPMNTTAGNDDALLIGCDEDTGGKGLHFNGYMSEFFWIDSTQYAASNFGELDGDTGIWIPKKGSDIVDDLTMGTNGVYLEFKETGTSANSSGIGADTGGNNLHFTVTNLVAADICVDTPTNNFATLNPLDSGSEANFSEGACRYTGGTTSGAGAKQMAAGTLGASSGKWYFEVKRGANDSGIGVAAAERVGTAMEVNNLFQSAWNGYCHFVYTSDGNARSGNADSSYGGAVHEDDIIGVALDLDNGAIYYSDNGTWMDSGDPTSGASKTGAASNFPTSVNTWLMGFIGDGSSGSAAVAEFNFGNPTFSISSGNADANGYGNFEYAPPSGYYAPCTRNLAKYG